MSILAENATQVIPAGTWTIDPVHSSVEFHVTHTGVATVKGRALVLLGNHSRRRRAGDRGNRRRVEPDDVRRDARRALETPDFFDAERYPELRFRSSSVTTRDDRSSSRAT